MITELLENELYKNLYQTLTLVATITILSLLIYVTLVYAIKISTSRQKLKTRVMYLSGIAFVIFSAKIWVQGFTHIFYGLSLVSAGLVVSNKETIMNLVGWGIISWRGLFSEGDYIEVAGQSGIVYDVGILYFKLLDANGLYPNRSTGKIIKVPNGFVINNIIKRFSIENHIIEQQVQCLVPLEKAMDVVKPRAQMAVDAIIQNYMYTLPKLSKSKKDMQLINHYVYQKPVVNIGFYLDKPEYYKLTISYHVRPKDKCHIESLITTNIAQDILADWQDKDSATTKPNQKRSVEGAV